MPTIRCRIEANPRARVCYCPTHARPRQLIAAPQVADMPAQDRAQADLKREYDLHRQLRIDFIRDSFEFL